MPTHVSYTVRATQRINEYYVGGGLAVAKGTEIYLVFDEEGGGYPQWSDRMPKSTLYESPERALKTAFASDAMPWWMRPDMLSLKVVRLTNVSEHFSEDV